MQLDSLKVDIYAYRGTNENPQWTDDEPGEYIIAPTHRLKTLVHHLCQICTLWRAL
jgi:hypothetical protein